MAARKVRRNDACPCGSGRKYKQCCAGKTERRSQFGLYTALAVIVAIVGVIAYTFTSEGSGPRRVWVPEHGHYHTVP